MVSVELAAPAAAGARQPEEAGLEFATFTRGMTHPSQLTGAGDVSLLRR